MEASLVNRMMATNQAPESGTQQKSGPVVTQKTEETDINLEKHNDEMPGSEANQKLAEMCLGMVEETNINPEKQTDPQEKSEVDQKSVETSQDTGVESNVNPEKQADPELKSEVDLKSLETCLNTVVVANVNPEKQTANPGVIYRCKKCRRMVATQEYIVSHKVGQGEKCFLRRKSYHVEDKEPECTCIFVEPMKWMQAVEEGYVSHKLWCMDCKTRLGSFNWAGMQCSCGAWVIPAFQLLKSRIDESHM